MKRVVLLLIPAMVLAACGGVVDDAVDDPAPSQTTAGESASHEADPAPGAIDKVLPDDDLGTADESVAESDELKPGTGTANVEDGTPNETRDPDVELPDLPAPTLVRPRYPNTEPVIPPPRG